MNNDVRTIEWNYDNLGVLRACKYLLGVVINDIKFMNDLDNEKATAYDLGNGFLIRKEDFESIVSIIDTINNIEKNNEVE